MRKTLYNIDDDERRNNYLCFCSEYYTHRLNITFSDSNGRNLGDYSEDYDDVYFKVTRVKRHKIVYSSF